MMKRMIFGCGYLGFPTAKNWVAAGDDVIAVTRDDRVGGRRDALVAAGMVPKTADVTEPDSLNALPAADTVLFAVGMDRTRYSDMRSVYVDGLKNVLDRLPQETGHLIYISSTGVYGDFDGQWIDESSPTHPLREGGQVCLDAEALIRSSRFADRATILRIAGIYGSGRIPLLNAVKNRDWSQLESRGHLNLIAVEDGARVIQAIADQRPMDETVLVSDGQPVLRTQFYEAIASLVGTGPIQWPPTRQANRQNRSDKRISNAKLLNLLNENRTGDEFVFSNFRSVLGGCLRNE